MYVPWVRRASRHAGTPALHKMTTANHQKCRPGSRAARRQCGCAHSHPVQVQVSGSNAHPRLSEGPRQSGTEPISSMNALHHGQTSTTQARSWHSRSKAMAIGSSGHGCSGGGTRMQGLRLLMASALIAFQCAWPKVR
jgi:hypothetical protein